MRRSRVRFPPRARSISHVSSIAGLPQLVGRALRESPNGHPYPRFVLDDVLEASEYERLLAHFPDHLVGEPGDDGFKNFTIRPDVELTEDLSPEWRALINTLRSPKVRAELAMACLPHTLKRYPFLWRWMLSFRLRNTENYQINLAFSANYAGRYLPPHTDNSYKVLALVLYFASAEFTGADEGTRFFSARSKQILRTAIRRYNRLADSRITKFAPLELQPMTSCNIHDGSTTLLEKQASEAWFYENFENDFNVSFGANRIAGFVKTQASFHEVDMRNSTVVGPRRSLLINLNLKHSLPARAWQSFRTRVLGLSS
jgi:hypothetical protein